MINLKPGCESCPLYRCGLCDLLRRVRVPAEDMPQCRYENTVDYFTRRGAPVSDRHEMEWRS
ncbi:MAG: hypothetical protein ACP5VS_08085 [Desulfomonilaceae bacterium]